MKLRRTITEANIAPKILADPRLSKMLVLAMRHDPTIPRTKIAKLGPRVTDAELIQLWSDILDDSLSRTKYGDLSRDGKFDQWLTRLYTNHTLNYEDVNGEGGDALGAWKALSIRSLLDPKDQDFNKFTSLEKLQETIRKPKYAAELRKMEDAEKLAKIKRDAKQEILIDDERFTVFVPLNYGSTYYFNNGEGITASFCTGSSSGQYWFEKYSKDGPIVCILDKKNMDKQKGKWQMHSATSQLNDALQQNDKSKSDEEFSELFPGLMKRIVKELNANSEELKTKSKDLDLARGGWNLAEETSRIKRKYPLSYSSKSGAEEDDLPVWKVEYLPYDDYDPEPDPVYISAEEKDEAFTLGTQALNEISKQQYQRGLNPLGYIDIYRGSGDTAETWEQDAEGDEAGGQETVEDIRQAAIASGSEPRNWLWETNEIVWRITDEDTGNLLGYYTGGTRRSARADVCYHLGITGRDADSLEATPGKRVAGVWQDWNERVPEQQTSDAQLAQPEAQAGELRSWEVVSHPNHQRMMPREFWPGRTYREAWESFRQIPRLRNLTDAQVENLYDLIPRTDEEQPAEEGPEQEWRVTCLTRGVSRNILATSARSAKEMVARMTGNTAQLITNPREWDARVIPDNRANAQPPNQPDAENDGRPNREWEVIDMTSGRRLGIHYNAPSADEAFDRFINYMVQEHGANDIDVAARYNVVPLGQR